MLAHSAGILVYKYIDGKLYVMLSHPGGPYWIKKDNAAWSIPKGLVEENEEVLDAALREFEEETGVKVDTNLIELGTIKQSSQKMVTVFATNKDVDTNKVTSNTFEMEWPPKSGNYQEFPENDRSQWFDIKTAKVKIFKGQIGFLEKLVDILDYRDTIIENDQISFFE